MSATEYITQQLQNRIGITEVKAIAQSAPTDILFHLMYSTDSLVARNAAWALTHQSDSSIITINQDQLINLAMDTPSQAIRRLSLSLILRQGISCNNMRSDFLDFCLSHMHLPEEPSGIQALCIKLAYIMCSYYPELLHEFNETIKLMHSEHYTPGVRHLLSKLKK